MAKKTKNLKYYEAVGRRKEAVAQVRLYVPGKEKKVNVGKMEVGVGECVVNGKPVQTLFASAHEMEQYLFPLKLVGSENRFAISIKVRGGGKVGQLAAIIHGIASALVKVDDSTYKQLLKKQGLLKRDARTRQRRMVGMGGKSRRKKQSPKR